MKLRVILNGTAENRWHEMGLTQNPFPQIAKYELLGMMNQLNSLDGEPLKNEDDIRQRLVGWSEEFIELCIKNFKPGQCIGFEVTFPDKEDKL